MCFSGQVKNTTPLLCLAAVFFLHIAEARGQKPCLTKDEVIDGVLKFSQRWNGLSSWMIHYKNERENVNPAPGSRIQWPPADIVNARNKKGWFYGHIAQNTLDGQLKINHWLNWKDKVCVERREVNVMILPEPSNNIISFCYYPDMLCLDIFSDFHVRSPFLVRTLGTEHISDFFPDAYTNSVVKNKSSYHLRPEMEKIDNALCYVLERPQKDILWIDPSLGFVSRKRIQYHKEGAMAWIATNEDFKEFADGLWLPRLQQLWGYNPPNVSAEYQGKIANHYTNKVSQIRINDLSDGFFDVPIPDDAIIDDYIRGVMYHRPPSSADPLGAVIKDAQLSGIKSTSRQMKRVVISLIFLGLALFLFLLRRIKKKSLLSQ